MSGFRRWRVVIETENRTPGLIVGLVEIETNGGAIIERVSGTEAMRNNIVRALMERLSELIRLDEEARRH